ncbi:MAG: YkuS family protein [Candidatus Saccharibacteria bacterium]
MKKTIAVEDNLAPFKEYLAAQGCQIVDVSKAKGRDVDAIVLSGADMNIMGIQDRMAQAPVINAAGLRPEQVWRQIQQRTPER